jgi:hypothetical protein
VTGQIPSISGLKLSADTGSLTTDFVTNEATQTIRATLSSELIAGDILYGRLDGVAEGFDVGNSWINLSSKVSGNQLIWDDAILLTGPSKSISLQVVRAAELGQQLSQSYELITAAPTAPTTAPSIVGGSTSGSGFINVEVSEPPQAGERVVLIVSQAGGSPRVVPSLYHAATNTIMPLSALPEGAYQVQYAFEDRAGNISTYSPRAPITIISPSSSVDSQSLDGDGIDFSDEKIFADLNNDGIDDADQRDVVSFAMSSGASVSIDTSLKSDNMFSMLLENGELNPDGKLRIELQIDGVTSSAVSDAQKSSALSVAGLSSEASFDSTDVLAFRVYPQVIRLGNVDETIVNDMSSAVINSYIGQIQRIDIVVPEGNYNIYFKVSPTTGEVTAFTWDEVSQTGAKFFDTDNDGSIDLVSLYVRDGGRGDDDGVADGVILDPGFAASVIEAPTPPVTPVDPSNPSNTTNSVRVIIDVRVISAEVNANSSNLVVKEFIADEKSWQPVTRLLEAPKRFAENPFRAGWAGLPNYAGREQFSELSTYASLVSHDSISWISESLRDIEKYKIDQTNKSYQTESYEVKPGDFFTQILSSAVLGNEKIASFSAVLMDGAPAPIWLKFDPIKGTVYGDIPRNFVGPLEVKLSLKMASGKTREVLIKIGADKKIIMSGKPSFEQSMLKASVRKQ